MYDGSTGWEPINYSNMSNGFSAQQANVAAANVAAGATTGGVGSTAVNGTGTTYNSVNPTGVGNYGGAQQNGPGFWSKDGGAGMILGGLQTIGNLWNAYQQQKLAKDAFAFQKKAFETNLKNSTQTYNTALEDRIRARHNTEGRSSGETDAYLDKHRL